MQEIFEKIKERLEESGKVMYRYPTVEDPPGCSLIQTGEKDILVSNAIEIVNQVAEEYNNESVNGDLISRSALLKTLNEYVEKAYDCGGIDDENVIEYQKTHKDKSAYIIQGFSEVYELLEDVPTVYNDGWIPCSERLPEDKDAIYVDEDVIELNELIVQIKGAEIPSTAVFVDGEFKHPYEDDGYGFADKVIAWQPLPKKYQPKGE